MLQAKNNYVDGTAAVKLEYDVYSENKVLSEKKRNKARNKEKLKTVAITVAIFALGLVLMYRYALITDMSYKVNKADNEYNKIKNENSRLRVEIEKEIDLSNIKRLAEEKLNMQKPDKYQIVYLRVPKSDYTIVNSVYKMDEKQGNSMFASLFDRVSKFIQLLY